uniref:Kelch-like family member 5 n=1 Tax=Astyanax mexicanus TaxID=7994 RepID=A0A8B9J6K4_ASTMX
MSTPRRDFDVKQILRIRWRWFGHATSPPPGPESLHEPLHELFSVRSSSGAGTSSRCELPSRSPVTSACSDTAAAATGTTSSERKLPESGGGRVTVTTVATRASACPRSASQHECGSAPRSSPAHSRSALDVSLNVNENPELGGASGSADCNLGDEENNNNNNAAAAAAVESDSSSCRTSNSSATLSSCVSMEPCVPDELFQSHSHAEHTFRRMETYLRTRKLCDVVLLAGDRRIPAHRLVLSSVSDYFAAMFTSDVREAKQEEVKMEGVDPDALWVLVQYAYTGRLELREDTIESLLSAACLLQLSAVVQACCTYLMKQLHPSNCLGIRSFADAQGCQDLHKVAHNYTMEHFLGVMKNQEFLLLPASEVEKLLASDDMNVPDEETVVSALLSWVRHDPPARQSQLPGLLAHVRLPLLKPQRKQQKKISRVVDKS